MSSLNVFGVIPARLKASRFPNKPLALISGETMISRVVKSVLLSKKLKQVIVATDDEKIREESQRAGATVIMTESDLASGTDRVYHAIKNLKPDAVINIQGDEPLIQPDIIDDLVSCLEKDQNVDMATIAKEISTIEELTSPNIVKVITNKRNEAIYFSRFPIPYSRVEQNNLVYPLPGCYKHIGIYAYRFELLSQICQSQPVEIEKSESLEQLRALYLGAKIKVLKTDHFLLGVDIPDDIQKVEKWLQR